MVPTDLMMKEQPASGRFLIKDGYLTNYMYDRLTAQKEGKTSTGNGRRESYQHKPIPRMSNTFIASGSSDPEEIIKSTKRGLSLKKWAEARLIPLMGISYLKCRKAIL